MNKLTVTIDIEKHGDEATAKMKIVDENNSSDFGLPAIQWLAVARILSNYALETMEKAAAAIQQDDLRRLEKELKGGQQ